MKKAGIYRAPYQPKVRPWVNYTHYNDYTEYNIAVVNAFIKVSVLNLLCINPQYVIIVVSEIFK